MAHEKPFRLRVLEALTALLSEIERTAGVTVEYQWSLATDPDTAPDGKVFRGRGAFGTNDPLPMIAIVEDPKALNDDEARPETAVGKITRWPLIIQGFVKDDPVHPTDPAYFLMEDVRAKLRAARADRKNVLGFGYKAPGVIDIYMGTGVVRPPDNEISATTYFWLPVELCLAEDESNAFT